MHLSTNTLQNNVLDPETESCDITEGDNAVIIQGSGEYDCSFVVTGN